MLVFRFQIDPGECAEDRGDLEGSVVTGGRFLREVERDFRLLFFGLSREMKVRLNNEVGSCRNAMSQSVGERARSGAGNPSSDLLAGPDCGAHLFESGFLVFLF